MAAQNMMSKGLFLALLFVIVTLLVPTHANWYGKRGKYKYIYILLLTIAFIYVLISLNVFELLFLFIEQLTAKPCGWIFNHRLDQLPMIASTSLGSGSV